MEKDTTNQRPPRTERRPREINMEIELFIDPPAPDLIYSLGQDLRRSGPKGRGEQEEEPGIDLPDAFVKSVRFEAIARGGRYTKAMRRRIITGLKHYDAAPGAPENITALLLREGSICERMRDFESALDFYETSQIYHSEVSQVRFFRLNNLGFILLYFRRFQEAEGYLRRAIEESPERYNAWKNMGVALEHQCQYEEAAQCYIRACQVSGGEPRSVMHLSRLVNRHPVLSQVPAIRQFVMGE